MISTFKCSDTESPFNGKRVARFVNIQVLSLRKLAMLNRAENLGDLHIPPIPRNVRRCASVATATHLPERPHSGRHVVLPLQPSMERKLLARTLVLSLGFFFLINLPIAFSLDASATLEPFTYDPPVCTY